MNSPTLQPIFEIKKYHNEETVNFAINHIPEVDQATLERFLELVYTSGNFGSISLDQISQKMRLTLKYVPGACSCSLLILIELLGLYSFEVPNVSH